jgi:transcriptional antiterminator NusG
MTQQRGDRWGIKASRMRVVEGPFKDFIGVVEDFDFDTAKVKLALSFFGRETVVELDFAQVERP